MNIEVTPAVLQNGTEPITIIASELGKNEKLPLVIRKPNGDTFTMDLEADENGLATESIYLVDGEGTYTIAADAEQCSAPCYGFEPINVLVQKCAVGEAVETLQLFSSATFVQKGTEVILTVYGRPNAITVLSQQSNGIVKPIKGKTDESGLAVYTVTTIGMRDIFIAMQMDLVSNQVQVDTAGEVNTPVQVRKDLVFKDTKQAFAVEQDVVFPVTIQVQNTTEKLLRLSITDISGDLTLDMPVRIEYEGIAKGSTREFTFFVSGKHLSQEAKSMGITIAGFYSDERNEKKSCSHSYSVMVPARKLNAGLIISSLLLSPATIYKGDNTVLQVEIINVGETDIKGITLAPQTFKGVAGQLGFNNVFLARGGKYVASAVLRPADIGTYMFNISGSLITGESQDNMVVASGELTTNVVVLGK